MYKTHNKISWANNKNDLETNHFIYIPEYIQKVVAQRWFYVYEWIGVKDVKESVESEFLLFLRKYALVWILILLISSLISLFTIIKYFHFVFIWILIILNLILFFHILIRSIYRSKILINNNKIVITDSSILIDGKLYPVENNRFVKTKNITKITHLFSEELFHTSRIHDTKNILRKILYKYVIWWYTNIAKHWSWSWSWFDKKIQIWILSIFYTIYVLLICIIFISWIILLQISGTLISFVNKKILLITGHKLTIVNQWFENIDRDSQVLEKNKHELLDLLEQAKNNDWKDGLLWKIQSEILEINKISEKIINESLDLQKQISSSKHSKIFNFSIYNSWIKKQILTPLEEIKKLLTINLELILSQLDWVKISIKSEKDIDKIAVFQLTQKRLQLSINQIQKYIENIDRSIHKLK
mgnify:CR=1 FL=1